MRILQLTHQGDAAGSTNSITWLCRGLAERGHEVSLGCRPESLIAGRFSGEAVRVVPVQFPRGLRLAREAFHWRAWIDHERIDVVNAHASLDRHLVSYLRLAGCRAVLIHTRRNMSRSSGGRARTWFDALTTDAIVAVSGEVADDLVRRGTPRRHVHVIRNGIPFGEMPGTDASRVDAVRRQLSLPDGIPVVGVVARRKSHDDLLRAAILRGQPLTLLFAGVEEDPVLTALARDLPQGSRLYCLGFRDDIAELSALFDVFVLPSEIEGFSLALLEAMARGLPCIATDVGGNREALAEDSGILVPPRDPEALAKALSRVLDNPEASQELGRRAKARAIREFDVSATIQRTHELYESLVSARRG